MEGRERVRAYVRPVSIRPKLRIPARPFNASTAATLHLPGLNLNYQEQTINKKEKKMKKKKKKKKNYSDAYFFTFIFFQ